MTRSKPVEKSGLVLLSFGILAIAYSFVSNSLISSLVGLTLTLWGFLFMLVLPKNYVSSRVSDSMTFSSLAAISNLIISSDCRGKAVYLPPFSKNVYIPFPHRGMVEDGFVFVFKREENVESVVMQNTNSEAFVRNAKEGLSLVQPGLRLASLMEKELGVDFSSTNLDSVVEMLPNLFVHDLELADKFKMNLSGNTVKVEVDRPVYEEICREVSKLGSLCPQIGCPVSSSIACILTKATGKPVFLERCILEGHFGETWYRILEGQ